jgi:hypothetical protein
MMDLLGSGNPYIRRYAEGGEAELEPYMRSQASWIPGRYSESYAQGRPELTMTLAELQAQNPFYSTPQYLEARKNLANLVLNTQAQREDYVTKAQALENEWRRLAGVSEVPESLRQQVTKEYQDAYLASMAPNLERATKEGEYYGDLANRITGYLETARPGQRLDLPRNPFSTRGFLQPFNFVLDDPNNPFTYEQRKGFTDQGYSVVDRGFIENYLKTDILPKQAQLQESLSAYTDPTGFMRTQEQAYNERLQDELRKYRTAEQARVEGQIAELQNQIRPVVDTASSKEADLRGQIEALQRGYVRPDRVLVPTQPQTPAQGQTPTPTPTPTPVVPVPTPTLPVYTTPQAPSQPPSSPTEIPTAPSIPPSNLTPLPLPGITPPPAIGGIPQPSIGYQNPLYQSLLPQYQSPTSTAMQPTQQQQSQQPQFQYGPIGQAAVGPTNLLSTLLSQQQDPTKVSLLGFDNPYLMKPFG